MTRRLFFELLGLIATALRLTGASEDVAKVQLHATDAFGQSLGPVEVRHFSHSRGVGRDYKHLFVGSKAEGISFGEYTVAIKAGNVALSANLIVDKASVFHVLSGSGWIADRARGARLSPGVLNRLIRLPVNSKSPVWVRIISLFGDDAARCQSVRIEDDGSFTVPGGLDIGEYAIVVLDGSGELFSSTLKFRNGRSRIEVNVAAGTINLLL